MKRKLIILFYFFCAQNLLAQNNTDMLHMHMDLDTMEMVNTPLTMTSSFSNNLPMNRDGSGTSWQPDDSPKAMYMKMRNKNTFMLHGFLFFRFNTQKLSDNNKRGSNKFDAPNMFMFMWQRKFDIKNLFAFHSMFSLDPLTVGESGYPLLFQTGESYKGVPLVDKQHPHDLFAELSANYTYSFTTDVDLNTYFGYPGEPALGPVVFMHRLSGINNPNAPLSHHRQDATHITFGVGTLGIRYKVVKLEGSIFTGREPDEHRYDFDKSKFDSHSERISISPNKNFALQVSSGFIKSPEELFPDENITRTTASITHTKQMHMKKFISTTLVWGMNHSSAGNNTHSFLFENNLRLNLVSIFYRYEFVQKDARELNLGHFEESTVFNIQAFTLGFNKILFSYSKTDISMGMQGTLNFPDRNLEPIYGNLPVTAAAYIKIAPSMTYESH
jgi:hypothetical protein